MIRYPQLKKSPLCQEGQGSSSNRVPRSSNSDTLFDPDSIATEIHQALELDFTEASQVYCLDSRFTLNAFHRQCAEFRKKYCPVTYDKDGLTLATYQKFLDVNEHMGAINERLSLRLSFDCDRIQSTSPYLEKIHKRARALMHNVLGDFDVAEWFLECKNSGGSSLGVPFLNTSQERKFTMPMTTTEEAMSLFNQYLTFDSQLKVAIQNLNGGALISEPWYEVVEGSRATTVDKTSDKRRFIAVEPTCNMFLQQGLMGMMYKRMKKVGLNVETLPALHRQLAKESSITGRNATIDWSSASDCVSIELLRTLLPPRWFRIIMATRSPFTRIGDVDVKLNMISSMGNAVTFPLETLVFWTYAHAVLQTQEQDNNSLFKIWNLEEYGRCSVFGDDCIVPSTIAEDFISVMEEVGFIINKEKSYYGTERFRESCGGDYLEGYDIRPYFLKAPRSTKLSSLEPWLYIIGNSLIMKYISYFGETSYVYDKELWRTLFGLFRRYKLSIKLVPSFYPDDAGLKLSFDIQRFHRHYPMKLSRIDQSKHGTTSFRFLNFRYRKNQDPHDEVRYNLWLKKPSPGEPRLLANESDVENDPNPHVTPIRRIGGYVVARGVTCHWYVPVVKPIV